MRETDGMRDGPDSETDIQPVGAIRVSETGLHEGSLFKLILKTLFVRGVDTPKQVADSTKLHIAVVRELLETAKNRSLVEVLGSIEDNGYSDFRYALTGQGRERGSDALEQCQYIGPAHRYHVHGACRRRACSRSFVAPAGDRGRAT